MKNIRLTCSVILSCFLFSLSKGNTTNENGSDYGEDKIFSDTDVRIHNFEHVWTINRADILIPTMEIDDSFELKSPDFWSTKTNEIKWYMKLEIYRPNGNNETFISLNLRQSWDSSTNNYLVKRSVVILNNQQQEIWSEKENSFHRCTYKKFGGFSIPKNKLLACDKLIIKHNITFAKITHHESIPHFKPENDLSRNYELLFENERFSDLTISVNGIMYKVHKAVLAAQSPVFATIIERYTKTGNELKQINITDIKTPVFYQLLRYIYTGKLDYCAGMARDLLVAADKYELRGLKLMCGEALQKTLTFEQAADTLVIADMCDVRTLKLETIKYIVHNFPEVSNTVAWKSMILSDSKLVDEVCKALFDKNLLRNEHEKRKYCSC